MRAGCGRAGLERNKFDGEKCVDFFETYKQCKKEEVMLCPVVARFNTPPYVTWSSAHPTCCVSVSPAC